MLNIFDSLNSLPPLSLQLRIQMALMHQAGFLKLEGDLLPKFGGSVAKEPCSKQMLHSHPLL